MTNDFDESLEGSEEPIENKSLYSKIFEEMMDRKKDKIREKIEKNMDEMVNADLTETEMSKMFDQFGTYASLQMLRLVAFKLYGKKANALMSEIIEGFISQGKQTLMVKQQIDSIEQQDSKITNILGKDLVEKERDLVSKRVEKIYNEFRNEIKQVLLIPEKDLPDDDHNNDDDLPPWENSNDKPWE